MCIPCWSVTDVVGTSVTALGKKFLGYESHTCLQNCGKENRNGQETEWGPAAGMVSLVL